jgi:hypothetical protein
MRSALVVVSAAFLAAGVAFAQDAVFTRVSGKVEVNPGSGWKAAAVGTTVAKGTMISTGFDSTAVLEVGQSTVSVRPLTRMSLEELVQQPGSQTTSLYLRTGKVTAQVKTAEGLKQDFKLRSPVSTAAVRGTSFTYDGHSVRVSEGVVQFINRLEQRTAVAAGEGASTNGRSLLGAADVKELTASVNPSTGEVTLNIGGGVAVGGLKFRLQ